MTFGNSVIPLWISNLSLTGMGCTVQYRICGSTLCTNLGGMYQISDDNSTITRTLGLNEAQSATLSIIWRALFTSRIDIFFDLLGQEMFRSRDLILSLATAQVSDVNLTTPTSEYYCSAPVSSNQWQLEAQNIQNAALALVQNSVVGYASPTGYVLGDGTSTLNYLIHPSLNAEKSLCGQQKVRSTAHSSFSVFGLAFLLATGSLIVGLAYAIPILVERIQLKSETVAAQHRRDEWKQNGVLQLLRAVSEDQNPGVWTKDEGEIPTTVEFGKRFMWVRVKGFRVVIDEDEAQR
jgi:hypothetical protein